MSVAVPALDVAQARLTAPTISPADYAALLQTDVSIVYGAIHGDVP